MRLPDYPNGVPADTVFNLSDVETIVRDCAKVVFDTERDDRKASPVSYNASLAILSRYALSPQEEHHDSNR